MARKGAERGVRTRPTDPAAPEMTTVSPSLSLPTSNMPYHVSPSFVDPEGDGTEVVLQSMPSSLIIESARHLGNTRPGGK